MSQPPMVFPLLVGKIALLPAPTGDDVLPLPLSHEAEKMQNVMPLRKTNKYFKYQLQILVVLLKGQ